VEPPGWLAPANRVIDCADPAVIELAVSKTHDPHEAVNALEDACLRRFDVLPRDDYGLGNVLG
jgi:hypothetical protein